MPLSSLHSYDGRWATCSRSSRFALGLPQAGLTLLEVIAATAIVLITVTAVTTITVTAARAGGMAEDAAAADTALLAEAARLRALPFFVQLPLDWPERRESSMPSAVGELFPHADVALNADEARYLVSGERTGAFETSVVVSGLVVRRAVWMARCESSGWRCAATTTLDGWHAWGGAALPAEALLVRLEVSRRPDVAAGSDEGGARALTFVLTGEARPRAVDVEALSEVMGEWTP
jgi:hypothetical protein